MKSLILVIAVLGATAAVPAFAAEESSQFNQEGLISQSSDEATPDQQPVEFYRNETINSCIKKCGHTKACDYSCTMSEENQN
jgi:hypothetical protein